MKKIVPLVIAFLMLICIGILAPFRQDENTSKRLTPAQFMLLFFEPNYLEKCRNLHGQAAVFAKAPVLNSCWCSFECNGPAPLKNAASYDNRGDTVLLTDFFIEHLPTDSLALMQSADIECLRGSEREPRWILHNRRTNKYFFRAENFPTP